MKNATLLVLLCVAACEKASPQQPRLFTNDELAALETRVLAEVNKSTPGCIRPEAVALWKPTGELATCLKECDVIDYGADHRKPIRRDELWRVATPEATALDAKCGAIVSAAFERAAANPGCSPFQIGIDNAKIGPAGMDHMHLLHLIIRRARAENDRASGARALVAGLRSVLDTTRGRVNAFLIMASAARSSLASNLLELLADAQLPRDDLVALAASLDQLIAFEPLPHDMLQSEAVHVAFGYGLVPLKGPSWTVPGGRNDLMVSSLEPSTSHDPRDWAGIMMMSSLESGERLGTACPSAASLRECFDHVSAIPVNTSPEHGAELLDRPREDDEATRARVKREVVESFVWSDTYAYTLARRARELVPLVALRLRVEVLRNGRCPTAAELDAPPFAALRAPKVLGDSVQVTPIDHALRLDPPMWVRDQIEKERQGQKPPFPPAAPSKVLTIPCP